MSLAKTPPVLVDLRSDTVTLPTPAMRERMASAPLGDDGLEGDPTVRALEESTASLLGKPAALFVASGTMGNLVAVLAHARGPGEVLAGAASHLLNSERGGAALAGLHYRGLPEHAGRLDAAALDEAIDVRSSARCPTALVVMENSHNAAGGTVSTAQEMAAIHAIANRHGVPVHTDGARLFNAAVALGVPAAALAAATDSLTFCLSKGLSAPVGSMLVGPTAFIERARGIRRMLGGTLRQAGVIAAAGLVALEGMTERLVEDHRRAQALHAGLRALDASWCGPELPQTNIVRVRVGSSSDEGRRWEAALAAQGVLVRAGSGGWLRLVTHRHIDDSAIATALAAFAQLSRAAR
ncbi:L-threonine aldolase [Polaromonas sp. OV174]|uniref:threonine aldolase family protein n=1 Tax=Polaromonas sp. OV174 TaxID=1855300 RepID=UPI0008DF0D1F|nr:GntG family PLP-dependent aldolase [Polaromonas sp. OV174]SFC10155.1 L-threonine aldolase [Polaromonas sp. OV174]